MEQSDLTKKSGLVRLCLIYRYVSLTISTLIYFSIYGWEITPLRAGIAFGIILASVMGSHLYTKNVAGRSRIVAVITACLEMVAYGIFIVFSGGFSSPYLWYSISAMTIIMAVGHYSKLFKIITPLAVAWCFLCALAGWRYGLVPDYSAYSGVNTAVAFLVVAVGFYILFIYMGRLEHNQWQMNLLNQKLQLETIRSEQALRHTMDIYELFNLFSFTNPGKVMEEITALLSRTIAPGGCLLLRISMLQEIESIASKGLQENEVENLLDFFADLHPASIQDLQSQHIVVQGNGYDVFYIHKLSGIQGLLIRACREENKCGEGEKAQEAFYLNLLAIIMRELDFHSMMEAYVICDEQNRIANEIHDTVIQKLFSVACNLRLLEEKQNNDEGGEQLKHIAKAVESTMRELREAIYGLRWEASGQNLFADKLNLYMEELKCLSGVSINMRLDDDAHLLTTNQKTIFYRIICEAANNAIRHGKATVLDIQLSVDENHLTTVICDNGCGFDQRQLPAGRQGLKNMYRMAIMLKGRLSIESQIGKGTVVSCILPR